MAEEKQTEDSEERDIQEKVRKGISPLIAAVLLLAFVMAVGALVSEWGNELVMDSTDKNTEDQKQLLDCSSKSIEFVETSEDYSNGFLNVTLKAKGGKLGNITVTAYPSLATERTELNSDNAINSTSLDVSNQQDSIRAASESCQVSIEEELE